MKIPIHLSQVDQFVCTPYVTKSFLKWQCLKIKVTKTSCYH